MTEDRMKFDETHFENAKGHAAALLKNAEKALEEGNIAYVGWSLDDARSYLLTMSQELEREGATAAARTKYDELKARYDALEPKYETMKDAIEKEEEIAAANERREKEEEERRRKEEAALKQFDAEEDASVVKLNVAVRNVLNILSAIKESEIKSDDVETINSTLLLLDELAEVVENDFNDIRERLEDVKKDAKIVTMVETVKGAFDARLRDKLVEDSIERLRSYKNREGDEEFELTNEAIFAAIHQNDDDLETVFEEVNNLDDKVWTANRFGVGRDDGLSEDPELVYEVTNKECWYLDLDLFIKQDKTRRPLATIQFKGYDNDAFRKVSAVGCEYAIAFDHFNEIL